MRTGLLVTATLIALCLCTSACCHDNLREPPRSVTVTQADSGARIVLPRDGTLTVCLKGNASTGYRWEVSVVSGLRQRGEPEVMRDSSAIGAGASYRYTFDAVAAGVGTLHMVYRRPWEKDSAPWATFAVQVEVPE